MSRDSQQEQRTERVSMDLHPAEAALIEYIRELEYGELQRVQVHQGLPVEIEQVVGKIRLLSQ